MPAWRNSRSPRDSNQIASGVTGAVHCLATLAPKTPKELAGWWGLLTALGATLLLFGGLS